MVIHLLQQYLVAGFDGSTTEEFCFTANNTTFEPQGTITGTGITQLPNPNFAPPVDPNMLLNEADFNATTAGPGVHTITFAYTDPFGCVLEEELDIEVLDVDDPTIVENEIFCSGGSIPALEVTDNGDTYLWFGPSAAAPTNVTTGEVATGLSFTPIVQPAADGSEHSGGTAFTASYWVVASSTGALGTTCFSCPVEITLMAQDCCPSGTVAGDEDLCEDETPGFISSGNSVVW